MRLNNENMRFVIPFLSTDDQVSHPILMSNRLIELSVYMEFKEQKTFDLRRLIYDVKM